MFFRIKTRSLALLTCCISTYAYCGVQASESVQQRPVIEQSVLKDFVNRMRNSYARANVFLSEAGLEDEVLNLRGLPDGEILILEIRLPENVILDGTVLAEIQNRQIYVSMRDMISVLEFPIEYDNETQNFSGWYVRENRSFDFDKATGIVRANDKQYNVGSNALYRDDDVFVLFSDLESWFNLELKPNIELQQVKLDANPPLPVMERIARRKSKFRNNVKPKASLPRGEDGYGVLSFPQIDVSTRTDFRKPENGKSDTRRSLNVRTAGEFAYGALETSVSANDEDQITNARVTYLQESADPELLGSLKARRFELGDIEPTRLPITGNAAPETGVRITNADPFFNQTLPTTRISGYVFPGWDIELYRENALLAFVETDENGYYSFDDVRLFLDRNLFRVVAYGPQGEVREENVNVPYDANRAAKDKNVYDVSVSLQNRNFYNKFDSVDEDANTPHFVGFFETPLTGSTALRLGARYREEDNEHKAYASAGLSSSYLGTLVNATVATDEQAELGAEFVATRRLGAHNFRTELDLATENYNPGQFDRPVEVFANRYALEGPVPFQIGKSPRYATSFSYGENSEGVSNYNGRLNFNTTHNRLGFNQSFLYTGSSSIAEDRISSQSSITGSSGRNTYRGSANYNIRPDSGLEGLFASWRRRISPELESQLEYGYTLDTDVSRLSGQLNWRPETTTITPRFSYDSVGNFEATLNTRFGITRNPDPGDFVFTRDFVTGNGTANVFVFLDKDGDKVFNGEDEPLPNTTVSAPQNGGSAETAENGVAFLSSLRPNIITDVFVEQGSLEDPFWIAGDEGVSIMPRTGTNVRIEIPVHNSGEIDGTVYAKYADGSSKPLRQISLNLYNEDGEIEQASKAGPDGFYLFSLVPPGRYALSVADAGLPKNILRPRPQFVEIGYDGTMLFGNDIFLEAGKRDIPNEILANLDDYKAQHPHIDFTNNDHKIALNLGQYKSRLLTSFMWYRLKTRYASIFNGTKLYVPPSQSYALPKTGEHILRVGLDSENLDDAYSRCRALVARDFYCKVEIYPTAKQQKFAAVDEK